MPSYHRCSGFLGTPDICPKHMISYFIPVESILGKLPVVPVGDFGSVPNGMRAQFPCALADRTAGAGDGCPVWFVNSWALGWSGET